MSHGDYNSMAEIAYLFLECYFMAEMANLLLELSCYGRIGNCGKESSLDTDVTKLYCHVIMAQDGWGDSHIMAAGDK